MDIRLIKRENIDKVKWDSCVHFANNGNLFGYTWYLDNVAKEWDALVEGDYESVFPLIKKKMKGGTEALHIPSLLPRSGPFSIHILSPSRVSNFIKAIPENYKIREINFNEGIGQQALTGFEYEEKSDYHLLLKTGWEEIVKGYSPELLEVLQDRKYKNYIADSSISPEDLTDFYLKHSPHSSERDKHTYLRIIYNLMHRGTGFPSAMRSPEGELLAVDYFAFSHGRVISMIPAWQGEEGRKALWKLTDMFIQSQSGKPTKFDFNTAMGNIGVEHFGAEKTVYRSLSENRLSGIRKWWHKSINP